MRWYAQIIVLAQDEDEVMEPFTRRDDERTWTGRFVRIPDWFASGWSIEFCRSNGRFGVLKDLESLPWERPHCVQVLLHDEDDDCFGLWMFHDGVLKEVPIARTRRIYDVRFPPGDAPHPGVLWRTDAREQLPVHAPEYEQDPRLSW